MIATYCDWHLGDHLIHLNFLRKLAARHLDTHFIHAAHSQYLIQLHEVVEDMKNISIVDLANKPMGAINAWKDRRGDIRHHPLKDDWAAFYIYVFDALASDMGFENPIKRRADFLFDYPRIKKNGFIPADFLIVNSAPQSGQLTSVSNVEFRNLVDLLLDRGHSIITTSPMDGVPCTTPMSVTDIGSLSLKCKYIVGVATGPIWPTFNVWNTASAKLRLLLLNKERILIAPNTEHAENMSQAIDILHQRKLL